MLYRLCKVTVFIETLARRRVSEKENEISSLAIAAPILFRIFLYYNMKFKSKEIFLHIFRNPLHSTANIGLLITFTTIPFTRNRAGLTSVPLFIEVFH
jgi:hypothetical protein